MYHVFVVRKFEYFLDGSRDKSDHGGVGGGCTASVVGGGAIHREGFAYDDKYMGGGGM